VRGVSVILRQFIIAGSQSIIPPQCPRPQFLYLSGYAGEGEPHDAAKRLDAVVGFLLSFGGMT